MNTKRIFTFTSANAIALGITSAVTLLGFLWPFFTPARAHHPQWIFLLAVPLSLLLFFINVSNQNLDAKSVALLAVLSALIAALRPIGTGAVGIEPMWFVLIVSARVFGPSFGFLLGAVSMLLSALLTGGIGPWLAYQCFAAAWIGLGTGLIPRKIRGAKEIISLVLYGVLAAEFFGIAMDLQFWPWSVGGGTQLSYIPGASLSTNLNRFFSYHFLSAMAWDIPRAIFTSVLILVSGSPILSALRRAYTRAAFLTQSEFISAREMASSELKQ
jgi:energy-coupling factor transport system substrate-specific component